MIYLLLIGILASYVEVTSSFWAIFLGHSYCKNRLNSFGQFGGLNGRRF